MACSSLAKASTSPEGENPTACTQPPVGPVYSPQTVLNGSFSPQTDAAGLRHIREGSAETLITHLLSTSLMYAEKTRAFMSALPAARRTLLGCQSMESTVDLMGFLSSLETHQSPSGSKEQIAIALEIDQHPACV